MSHETNIKRPMVFKLGGGFKYCYCHPYLGKIPILTIIFQMGWNHQLVKDFRLKKVG